MLYALKLGEIVTTSPTVGKNLPLFFQLATGFNVEAVSHRSRDFTFWDWTPSQRLAPLLKHYVPGMCAVVVTLNINNYLCFLDFCGRLN